MVVKNDSGVVKVPIKGCEYTIPRAIEEKFAPVGKKIADSTTRLKLFDERYCAYEVCFGYEDVKTEFNFNMSFDSEHGIVGVRILAPNSEKDLYRLSADKLESTFFRCEFVFRNADLIELKCAIVSKKEVENVHDVTAYTVTSSDAGLSLMYFDATRTKKSRYHGKNLYLLSDQLLYHAVMQPEYSEILPDKEDQAILDVSGMTLSDILDLIMKYYRDPNSIGTDIKNCHSVSRKKVRNETEG